MNTEQLCNHTIRLLHMPIHVYDENGIQTAVYVDNGKQQDVIECDNRQRKLLLEKGRNDYPVFHLEISQIIYGIIKGGSQIYVVGTCCLSLNETEAARHLIKTHQMDAQKLYKIFETSLDTFCEVIMMLYETATGESIRKGDMEALKMSFGESFIGKYGTLSRNPLRQIKNMTIVVITLACRSAIAGGMLPKDTFSPQVMW